MNIHEIARSFHDYIPDVSTIPSDIVSFGCEHSARQFARKVAPEYYTEIKQSDIPDLYTKNQKWMVYYRKYTPEQQEMSEKIIDKILTEDK